MEALILPIRKCPRCELNYILDDSPFCSVCYRDMKGDQTRDTLEFCSVCNENPSLPGKDLCLFCLKEMESAVNDTKESEGTFDNQIDLEGASEMEEIQMDTEDIPNAELGEIDRELSLDDVIAEEEMDVDDLEIDE